MPADHDEHEHEDAGEDEQRSGGADPAIADEPFLPGQGELAGMEQVDAEAAGHSPRNASPKAWRYCGPVSPRRLGAGTVCRIFTSTALNGSITSSGAVEPDALRQPPAERRSSRPAADGVARQALAVVLGPVERQREANVLGDAIDEIATRELGALHARWRGIARAMASVGVRRSPNGATELLREGSGADVEVARHHRSLLAEEAEGGGPPADIEQDQQLARPRAR